MERIERCELRKGSFRIIQLVYKSTASNLVEHPYGPIVSSSPPFFDALKPLVQTRIEKDPERQVRIIFPSPSVAQGHISPIPKNWSSRRYLRFTPEVLLTFPGTSPIIPSVLCCLVIDYRIYIFRNPTRPVPRTAPIRLALDWWTPTPPVPIANILCTHTHLRTPTGILRSDSKHHHHRPRHRTFRLKRTVCRTNRQSIRITRITTPRYSSTLLWRSRTIPP